MGARVWSSTVMEGEPFILTAYWVAPDRTVLNNTGSGQGGVTSTDLSVYRLTGPESRTIVWSGALSTSPFPVPTPTVGDGLSRYAKGWNFRYVYGGFIDFILEGGMTYELEFVAHGTGVLAGKTFDPMVMKHRLTVVPRKSG